MDANGAKRTVFMQHENIIGYQDDYVQNPEKHPMDFLSDIFKEKGWAKKTIGVEKDNYYFSAFCLESLQKNLPGATLTHDWFSQLAAHSEITAGIGLHA